MSRNILVKKETTTFDIEDITLFKRKAFEWARSFPLISYLDSNNYSNDNYHSYEGLLAVSHNAELVKIKNDRHSKNAFDQLKALYEDKQDWLFGCIGYDLKNEVEQLQSNNFDGIDFPEILFFHPEVVIEFFAKSICIHSTIIPAENIFNKINSQEVLEVDIAIEKPEIKSRLEKSYYLDAVEAIRQHIIEGDVYEMNFCQEFYAQDYTVDPYQLFLSLNKIGKAPFTAFIKWQDKFLSCASPERFLKKTGNQLISQPIKGTTKRGADAAEDLELRKALSNSEKDKAENVMIVDLVRNDLARSCKAGTVKVEELFGIYAYEQVHHMISTITGELRSDIHFVDAIRNAFPMGSMTGAPKVMAMELIEAYEKSKRGLYSGTVGYIKPNGDFDFNVVIRSVLYDAIKRYLSFQVGGAIVFNSDPVSEYEECLLKAKGILKALGLESV